MTRDEYIKLVASYFQKHGPEYGIPCVSAPTAQFCKESGFGTSELATNAQNYAGIKLKVKSNGESRTPIAIGGYDKASGEFYDGKYTSKVSTFAAFRNLEECVIGYLQFITSSSTYAGLKGLTDARTYCILIAPYATSETYSESLWSDYIVPYNLTQYDTKGVNMGIKIAIDAGHGSQTAGKRTPDGYKEHWINVKTAYYCEQYLKANGIETVRIGWNDTVSTDDADTPLATRQAQIKAAKCDYSVSLHANAYGSGWNSANGVETLIHSTTSKQGDSKKLAIAVQNRIIQGTKQTNRGVKTQELAMCNCSAMGVKAACLIEIGFMTNQAEAEIMKTDAFCKEQGEDVAKGVLDYLGVKTPTKDTYDYSLVFNATYYSNRYKDLKAVYGTDATKLLEHFKMFGMNEGRQAIDSFNVQAYKARYSDLQKAFGNDLKQYYIHYMQFGYKEKRIAI